MAQPKPSEFTAWTLSDEEELQGSVFNDLNLKKLQNLQCQYAQQSVHLKVDPSNILEFVQQQAFLTGQIQLIASLLEDHENAMMIMSQPLSERGNK